MSPNTPILNRFVYLVTAVILCLGFLLPGAADAAAKRRSSGGSCNSCGSDCGGKIITYNPDNHRSLSKDVDELMQKAKSQGHGPISCIRTQTCQNQLIRCYNACGQRGRAAQHSQHTDGTACDWPRGSTGYLNALKRQLGIRTMAEYQHPEAGAGLHDYSTHYVASGDNVGPSGPVGPAPKPASVAAAPKPALNAPANAGAAPTTQNGQAAVPYMPQSNGPAPASAAPTYSQMASGKYQCPSGLGSICGSTKDTPWCQSWMSTGHTPGCY